VVGVDSVLGVSAVLGRPFRRQRVTCRDEILTAAKAIVSKTGKNAFSIGDILTEMHRRRTTYADSTIRTHITSRLCMSAPAHHAVRYEDLVRLDRGRYALAH
jgi:hypothetical protein